jgi:nucleotide-binding universal stress UspA family protein
MRGSKLELTITDDSWRALSSLQSEPGIRSEIFRDILQFPSVDAENGWLIFALPLGLEVRAENDTAEQHFKEQVLPQIEAVGEASDIRVHSMFKVGNVAQSIISEAERGGFRIVALGHRGSSGIWGRFLGGVADRVSDQAHCDEIIVRQLS